MNNFAFDIVCELLKTAREQRDQLKAERDELQKRIMKNCDQIDELQKQYDELFDEAGDIREERDALRERISGAMRVWLYTDPKGYLFLARPELMPVFEHQQAVFAQLVHAVPVTGEEGE